MRRYEKVFRKTSGLKKNLQAKSQLIQLVDYIFYLLPV